MRLLPRSRSGAIALAALLLGVTAAVAPPAVATSAHAGANGSAVPPTPSPPPGCGDVLVTFHRGGIVGDQRAVAITAQALQREIDGWRLLAWEVDPGTVLTLVLVTGTDGVLRALPPTATGTVEDVLSLTFCGHRDRSIGALPATVATSATVTASTAARRSAVHPRGTVAMRHRHEQQQHMEAGR